MPSEIMNPSVFSKLVAASSIQPIGEADDLVDIPFSVEITT